MRQRTTATQIEGRRAPAKSRAKPAPTTSPPLLTLMDFPQVFRACAQSRVKLIRDRISASQVKMLARRMNLPQDRLSRYLHIPLATLTRKLARDEALSPELSERVVGLASLIGQVQTMVEESGVPEGFDAAQWTALWLEEPLPALGGQTPASYLDTVEGQKLVANLLSMMASGAYA